MIRERKHKHVKPTGNAGDCSVYTFMQMWRTVDVAVGGTAADLVEFLYGRNTYTPANPKHKPGGGDGNNRQQANRATSSANFYPATKSGFCLYQKRPGEGLQMPCCGHRPKNGLYAMLR